MSDWSAFLSGFALTVLLYFPYHGFVFTQHLPPGMHVGILNTIVEGFHTVGVIINPYDCHPFASFAELGHGKPVEPPDGLSYVGRSFQLIDSLIVMEHLFRDSSAVQGYIMTKDGVSWNSGKDVSVPTERGILDERRARSIVKVVFNSTDYEFGEWYRGKIRWDHYLVEVIDPSSHKIVGSISIDDNDVYRWFSLI